MFDEIAIKHGSDKSSKHHSYMERYEKLFSHLVNKEIIVAELGLQIGGPELGQSKDRPTTDCPSIKMWKEIFPKSKIYGFDISDFSQFEDDRFKFFRGDSSEIQNIRDFGRTFGQADLIIEDASHASSHQINALLALEGHIKPGGCMIVEDLHWQPWKENIQPLGETLNDFLNGKETHLDPLLKKFSSIDLRIYEHPKTNQLAPRLCFFWK